MTLHQNPSPNDEYYYRFDRFDDEESFYASHLKRFFAAFSVTGLDFELSIQKTQCFFGYMHSSEKRRQLVEYFYQNNNKKI